MFRSNSEYQLIFRILFKELVFIVNMSLRIIVKAFNLSVCIATSYSVGPDSFQYFEMLPHY